MSQRREPVRVGPVTMDDADVAMRRTKPSSREREEEYAEWEAAYGAL